MNDDQKIKNELNIDQAIDQLIAEENQDKAIEYFIEQIKLVENQDKAIEQFIEQIQKEKESTQDGSE
jgi:lipopolysaccharide biosynthesis regulator YciM